MKIVHIAYSTERGGAAIACRRLSDAMNAYGIESKIVTANQLSPGVPNASRLQNLFLRLRARQYWKEHAREMERYHVLGTWNPAFSLNRLDTNTDIQEADVIYLHWVCFNMVSIEELGRLLDMGKPVIWDLHDMWPLTGGCHYSFECARYQSHCGACPMLQSKDERDLSYDVFERKLRCLANRRNLTIVAPSNWLADCAGKSALFQGNRIEVIPCPIDANVFRPICKQVAREVLQLPLDKKLILFGCDCGIRNFYKGWKYLESALEKMDLEDKELVIFGQEKDSAISQKYPGKVHFLGQLRDERTSLALAYSAADVFVSLSIAENFSLVLCEASACQCPIVCFDVGGNSDIVLHKQTGYLAKYKNSDDLAKGICWILSNPEHASLAANARNHIEQLTSSRQVIDKHTSLIHALLSSQKL